MLELRSCLMYTWSSMIVPRYKTITMFLVSRNYLEQMRFAFMIFKAHL